MISSRRRGITVGTIHLDLGHSGKKQETIVPIIIISRISRPRWRNILGIFTIPNVGMGLVFLNFSSESSQSGNVINGHRVAGRSPLSLPSPATGKSITRPLATILSVKIEKSFRSKNCFHGAANFLFSKIKKRPTNRIRDDRHMPSFTKYSNQTFILFRKEIDYSALEGLMSLG